MGRAGSGPELHVNSGSGGVGSLHLWVGWVGSRKLDPRPTLRHSGSFHFLDLSFAETFAES